MNIFRSAGVATGLLVGVIIAVILVKLFNTNKRVKCDYDEREEKIQGKGYKYGFYTMLVYEALMMVLSVGGFPNIPIEQYVFHVFGIFLAITVYVTYSIWKGAYWARNNNVRVYKIFFVVCLAINLFTVIMSLVAGVRTVDGYLQFPFVNLACALMIITMMVASGIRNLLDKKADEED